VGNRQLGDLFFPPSLSSIPAELSPGAKIIRDETSAGAAKTRPRAANANLIKARRARVHLDQMHSSGGASILRKED
jgi:hypothetical protein